MLDKMSHMQQRLIIGSIISACLLITIYLSYSPFFNALFVLLTAAIISLALREYYHIARLKDLQPLTTIGIISTIAYVGAVALTIHFPAAILLPPIILALTLVAAFLYYFVNKGDDPLVNLAVTFFGIIYLTLPLSFIVLINYFHHEPLVYDGRWSLIYLISVTKMTDTGALYIGKFFGKTQLSTYISPKKTWEGAFGGLFAAILISIILYALMHLLFAKPAMQISFWQSIWLATLISLTAQFGDLAESLLKRSVGVKDSSRLPGLGGFLDIVDSMIFTCPLMYLFLKFQSL
jgi:phosphatidate cytidylyltransferase